VTGCLSCSTALAAGLPTQGVSDKLEREAEDVIDATLHTSERMVRQVYDRRRSRVAKPVK
jgi:hypothetical protein